MPEIGLVLEGLHCSGCAHRTERALREAQGVREADVNYTNFEEFLGAKVLVEGLRRAGPKPTRAAVIRALESLTTLDLGGIRVGFSRDNRVGSRYVEVTVIGSSGKLLK